MLPIPASVKAIIFASLVGVSGVLVALGKAEPTWAWATTVAGILGGLELLFTPQPGSKQS